MLRGVLTARGSRDVRVMTAVLIPALAFILARDNDLTLHVFGIAQPGAMVAILDGASVGTQID
jgi:uridylate kinase